MVKEFELGSFTGPMSPARSEPLRHLSSGDETCARHVQPREKSFLEYLSNWLTRHHLNDTPEQVMTQPIPPALPR